MDVLLPVRDPRCLQPLRHRLDGRLSRKRGVGKRLIEDSCKKQLIQPDQLTLHADRGTSMRSKPVALLLADLGVTKTHSRPHVSDDNPYSESQFRTMKYRPEFPDRFGCLQDSRAFLSEFFSVVQRRAPSLRHRLVDASDGSLWSSGKHPAATPGCARFCLPTSPERFVRSAPKPPVLPNEVWINKPVLLT